MKTDQAPPRAPTESDRARELAAARRRHSELELETAHQRTREKTAAAMASALEATAAIPEEDSKVHDLRELAKKHGVPWPPPNAPASPPGSDGLPTRPSPAALAASRQEPDEPEPDWRRALEPSPAPLSAPRILVVDDDPTIAATLRDVLLEEGYRVWTAGDGVEGMRRVFQMERVDVVLLDMQMPRADGMAFLEMLDASPWAATPVIVISAYAPPRTKLAGDPVVLHKPLDLPKALETIREQVRVARGREAAAPRRARP